MRRALSLAGAAVAAIVALTACSPSPTPPTAPAPAASTAALSPEDVRAWLDGLLPTMLEREGVVGATVAVVGDGDVLTERGYGYAQLGDAGDPRPVEADSTLFRIGSISKVFTATVVMRLVERGDLDLDAPVQDVLDFTVPTSFDEPITMRHLLTHTAGFEDELAGLITAPGGASPSLRGAVMTDPPAQIFAPGTTPAYSNYSNGLAAYVAERVAGVPFEELVRTQIFDVAGMASASLDQPLPEGVDGAMSAGYRFSGSEEVPFEVVSPAPAGAISATAADMSRFMLAQLGASTTPLLQPATLELMHAPALTAAALGGLSAGPTMTLGFFERDRNSHRILSHAGDLTAFHAQLELYPDDGAGIFISLNSSGIHGDSSARIREAMTTGFADRYFPDERPAPHPTSTAVEHAAALSGAYQLSRRGETTFIRAFFIASRIDVEAHGEVVTISAIVDATGSPVPFVETAPWVWTEVGGQRMIAVDQHGGAVSAIGFDPAFTLQPMPADRVAMPTVAAISVAILLLVLVLHPAAALVRRARREPAGASSSWRRAGWLAWAATLCLVTSVLPWSAVANALLTDGPAPHDVLIRTGQLLVAAAAMGIVPAVWRLVLAVRDARRHRMRVLLSATVVAAFAGALFAVLVGGLLQPSITY